MSEYIIKLTDEEWEEWLRLTQECEERNKKRAKEREKKKKESEDKGL